MYRYRFINIFGFISILIAIAGVICFFINPTITIVCGVVSIIDSLIQRFFGEQNSLITEILTTFVAIIVAVIAKLAILQIVAFALCLAEAILGVIGWIIVAIKLNR